MTKITAEEARVLASPSPQDHVNPVYQKIRVAASNNKRKIYLLDDFWVFEGYRQTAAYKEAVEILKKDGFAVKFFYEEKQLVDMYTIVEW